MKVKFFEEDQSEEFFAAMNEMYPHGKRSKRTLDGKIEYVTTAKPAERLGYFIENDGFYLIIRE